VIEFKIQRKVLISYENETLDIAIMRFHGRTELVINGSIYEEELGLTENSYELGAEVLGSKVKFINLSVFLTCYTYILIDDEIVAAQPRYL